MNDSFKGNTIVRMNTRTPSLWFNSNIDPDISFHKSVFNDFDLIYSRGPAGSTMTATFEMQ